MCLDFKTFLIESECSFTAEIFDIHEFEFTAYFMLNKTYEASMLRDVEYLNILINKY